MEILFAYGSLKSSKVQRRLLGREIEGMPDLLPNYRRTTFTIEQSSYYVAVPSKGESLEGIILEVSEEEIAILDNYESVEYKRVKKKLASGAKAWVYVQAKE